MTEESSANLAYLRDNIAVLNDHYSHTISPRVAKSAKFSIFEEHDETYGVYYTYTICHSCIGLVHKSSQSFDHFEAIIAATMTAPILK